MVEEEARAWERGREPGSGQSGGGAWPGGEGRATRKQGRRTRVLASGRGVAIAAGGEAGRCQGRGRRGGALPGLRAAGAGRWRHFDVGSWNLALFPQNVNPITPPVPLRCEPLLSAALKTHPAVWPRSCYRAPTPAPLLGMPFLPGKIQRPLLQEDFSCTYPALSSPGLDPWGPSIFQHWTGTEGVFNKLSQGTW